MLEKYVITIDGPAGAGKSTVAKALAEQLHYIYLDTGALYRAIAYRVLIENIHPDDHEEIAGLCHRINIDLKNVNAHMRVYVDDEDITDKIRTEKIGLLASKVSALPDVRKTLLSVQRESGKNGGVVVEGRDMGSVVFPEANFKFFLDASVEERSLRRYKELFIQENAIDFHNVKTDLMQRDKQDRERKIAPLIPPDGALVIDSTNMTLQDVIEKMLLVIKSYKANRPSL